MSGTKVLTELRQASRKGDRAALQLALAQMRTLANSPRYWEKYARLLRNPLARLVDLLVIKQGDRIAELKGWKKRGGIRPPADAARDGANAPGRRRKRPEPRTRRPAGGATQTSLFDELP